MRKLEVHLLIEKIKEVPTLPSVASRLIKMTVDEEAPMKELAKLIETDQSLTLKVLKVANSPFYSGISRVNTVNDAVVRLGLNALKSIVMSISVFDLVSLKEKSGLDWEKIWCHSLACAVCSKIVSSSVGFPHQEEAYLGGLLHDVGMIFLSQYAGDTYSQVVSQVKKGGLEFDDAERELLGIDHATVGKWVLEKWGLPEPVIKGVWRHHSPLPEMVERDPAARIADIVSYSNLLCTEIGMGAITGMVSPRTSSSMLDLVGLTRDDVERIIPDLHRKVGSLAGLFGISPDLEKVYFDAVKSANFALGNMVLKLDEANRSLQGELSMANVMAWMLTGFLEASRHDQVLEILVRSTVERLKFSRAVATLNLNHGTTLIVRAASRPSGEAKIEKDMIHAEPDGEEDVESQTTGSFTSRNIIVNGEPEGKLWLWKEEEERVREEDLEALSTLMKVVNLAVSRVRALQSSVDEGEKLQEILGRLNKAYQEISSFDKKFRTVVENSSDLIFRADAEGKILSCNSACRGLLGYSEAEMQNSSICEIPADLSLKESLLKRLREGDEIRNFGIPLQHRNGKAMYAKLSARGLRDSEGRLLEIVGVVRDVTEEKEEEEFVIQSERMSALGEMACRISHEFNNVFTLVLGRTELLLQNAQDEKAERGLRIIEQVASRGVDTVKKVMEFARSGTNLSPEPLEITSLVQKVMEATRPKWKDEAEERGINIEVKEDLQEGLWVDGVESELRDALGNIVSNAVDAMTESGTISIGARAEDSWAIITIEDTGRGMSEDVRRRIFEPFFSSKETKSFGLGLSITYGIIKRHGGRIDVASTPSKGTTFSIHLPLSRGNNGRGENINSLIQGEYQLPEEPREY